MPHTMKKQTSGHWVWCCELSLVFRGNCLPLDFNRHCCWRLRYELAALRTPFDGKSLMALAKAISLAKYDPIPSSYSPGLARLIAVMLNPV